MSFDCFDEQEPGRPGLRGVEEPSAVYGRGAAVVYADSGPIARSGQVVPALSGSHELRRQRRQSRHRRVSVAVPLPQMELLHRGGFYRLRTSLTDRSADFLAFLGYPSSSCSFYGDSGINVDGL